MCIKRRVTISVRHPSHGREEIVMQSGRGGVKGEVTEGREVNTPSTRLSVSVANDWRMGRVLSAFSEVQFLQYLKVACNNIVPRTGIKITWTLRPTRERSARFCCVCEANSWLVGDPTQTSRRHRFVFLIAMLMASRPICGGFVAMEERLNRSCHLKPCAGLKCKILWPTATGFVC